MTITAAGYSICDECGCVIEGEVVEHYWENTPAVVRVIPQGSWSVELYQGANYIVGSTLRSYSRSWANGVGMPAKYKEMVEHLLKMAASAATYPEGRLQAFAQKLQVNQP